MSKSNAIRSMFTFSNGTTPKVVVRNAVGEVRPAKQQFSDADMAELTRLRAEKAARETKATVSPKAKPVQIPTTVELVDVNGTKCVKISGAFKPKFISLAFWNLIKGNAQQIDSLLA